MIDEIDEMDVLRKVSLQTVQPPKAIWVDGAVVVEKLHDEELRHVVRRRTELREGGVRRNIRLVGRAGAGKSHFLSRVRRNTVESGDLFVAVHLSKASDFWRTVSLAYAEALSKKTHGTTQLQRLLNNLLEAAGLAADEAIAFVAGEVDVTAFPTLRRRIEGVLGRGPDGRTAADVALALLLMNSENGEEYDVGYSLFEGIEIEEEDRARYAFRVRQIDPKAIVKAMDQLVAATGHVTVTALDQLDGLIAVAEKALANDDRSELNVISNDLMEFAEIAEKTIIILACQRATWELIRTRAIDSAKYRFPDELLIGELPDPQVARDLVAGVLGRVYANVGFRPPYPTWPIKPSAFADAPDFTPRGLLIAVDDHIARCGRAGEVVELERLVEGAPPAPPVEDTPPPLADLDARFAALRSAADRSPISGGEALETTLPPLLYSGLAAWIAENASCGEFRLDEVRDAKASIHAKLVQILDAEREDEIHWCFRAIPNRHGKAQLSRLTAAVSRSGLGGRQRNLIVIRNDPFSPGAKTQAELAAFLARGGIVAPLRDEDVATFIALRTLLDENPPGLVSWLRDRRPASRTPLLSLLTPEGAHGPDGGRDANGAGGDGGARPSAKAQPQPEGRSAEAARAASVPDGHILLGLAAEDGRPVALALESLRKHLVVFAGSGSGKTVLVRRIIEECALAGVSAIVLDSNNDLARLGTLPPEPPAGWLPGDAQKAERYAREVEVVVWTPRVSAGRPLSFAPIAGLAAVAGEGDEFDIAVDQAVDLLVPRARLSTNTAKGHQCRAVLKQALARYAAGGGETLSGFLDFLGELPEGVSNLANAHKFAAEMAESLKAETENDPMFGDHGQAVDPAVLLSPSQGKRARVSVISFVGLPGEDQQQQFVSQLQLALFSHVKRHPAGDRPLGGLFVMDEAQNYAPSGAATPSTRTTLALTRQARKYGLGLVYASQAPKSLHNQIPGNASTQVLGFLSASAQIETAKELAANRGGTVEGISKLKAGQFFVAREGEPFALVRTPFCLTHHPRAPLSHDEVIAIARGG